MSGFFNKNSLFSRAAQRASFALSPKKALAFKRAEDATERARILRVASDSLVEASRDQEAYLFTKALNRYKGEGVWEELATLPYPPMFYACRGGAGASAMIDALVGMTPSLLEAPMDLGYIIQAPLEFCLDSGLWGAALHLTRVSPKERLSPEALKLAVKAIATRDGALLFNQASSLVFEGAQEPLSPSGEMRWAAARQVLDAIVNAQPDPQRAFSAPLIEEPDLSSSDEANGGASKTKELSGAASWADLASWMRLALFHPPLMRYLHERGADPNGVSQDLKGVFYRPIHQAAEMFNWRSCLELSRMGVDVRQLNSEGRSPLGLLARQFNQFASSKNRGAYHDHKANVYQTAETLIELGACFDEIKEDILFRETDEFYKPWAQLRRQQSPLYGQGVDASISASLASSGVKISDRSDSSVAPLPSRRVLLKSKAPPRSFSSPSFKPKP